MSSMNEFVTLVNRTSQNLEGMWDGKVHVIPAGAKLEFAKAKAIKFIEQNPVMGSEDARTGEMIYKLGCPEFRMDCEPLSDEFLAQFAGAIERWNRQTLVGGAPTETIKGATGLYSRRDVSNGAGGLATSTNFSNPNA